MYLGGYAIECRLKAIAMRIFGCKTLSELANKWSVNDRDVYTHGLESLMKRLPFYSRFRAGPAWRQFASQVNLWRPAWGYDPADYLLSDSRDFLDAVAAVYRWLDGIDT